MKRWVLASVVGLAVASAGGGSARADAAPVCAAPSELTRAVFALPRLARALAAKTPAGILVLNSATPAKKGAEKLGTDRDPQRTFPSFIEETLHTRYPDGGVVVTTSSQPRATAEMIVGDLPGVLAQTQPALVIWQTGTYDAILGADLSAFSDAVTTAIGLAQDAGADVIVMSPQYSPRTAIAIDVAPYVEALSRAARSGGVPFFDRYDIMRFWESEGIFDFDASRPSPSQFENVHRCIGRLLVGMIVDGVDTRALGSR